MKKITVTHALPENQRSFQATNLHHPHYQKFDEYYELDNQILRIRTGIEPASLETLHNLKAHLTQLKKELYCLVKS